MSQELELSHVFVFVVVVKIAAAGKSRVVDTLGERGGGEESADARVKRWEDSRQ